MKKLMQKKSILLKTLYQKCGVGYAELYRSYPKHAPRHHATAPMNKREKNEK